MAQYNWGAAGQAVVDSVDPLQDFIDRVEPAIQQTMDVKEQVKRTDFDTVADSLIAGLRDMKTLVSALLGAPEDETDRNGRLQKANLYAARGFIKEFGEKDRG